MLSLNTLIGRFAADFSREERLGLVKALHDLAHVDGNYSLIEQIGLESIVAILFPDPDDESRAMADFSGIDPLSVFDTRERRSIVLDTMCFTALSDSIIHPGEVAMVVRYARQWAFEPEDIRMLSCFDPIMLLEQGLAEAGEQLMEAIIREYRA